MLSVFQILLQRLTRRDDILVLTDIANRNYSFSEGVIGFFINQLVLRANLAGNPTFVQLLQQVRRTTLDGYLHQDVPFDVIVQQLQPKRAHADQPFTTVKFAVQNVPTRTRGAPALRAEFMDIPHQVAKNDFAIFVSEEAGSAGM